jgi:hypothetical protein
MAHGSQRCFNPYSLEENEQVPAKIWELLRRNPYFRHIVARLRKLDAKEQIYLTKTGKSHGKDWWTSYRLLKKFTRHPFAHIALQWLVPDPLFQCRIVTLPRGKKSNQLRVLRMGVGLKPNIKDNGWVWRSPNMRRRPRPITRGPQVILTQSRYRRLRSRVNPVLEWARYPWPFTFDHPWNEAPPQFRREFQFLWRSQFDCRPVNPVTNDRRDSPEPHETNFFRDWDLVDFRASGNLTQKDSSRLIQFRYLQRHYRVFVVPNTVLTKGTANEMGKWVADELKKGSDLHGDLLKGELLDESELFGRSTEWNDWLARPAKQTVSGNKDTNFYRRCRYMDSLVELIFPDFNLAKLLAKPAHRARGKKYKRKRRNE